MRAGVVGGRERADDELAGLHARDLAPDLDDHAAVLVAHVHGLMSTIEPAIGPEVRPADAGGREPDDRVGGLEDFGFGDVFEADIARGVQNRGKHCLLLSLLIVGGPQAPYWASVTCSSQSTTLPSSTSWIARCELPAGGSG